MTRVVKAPDVRRRELLETSLSLFAERGYDDTPVQEIADAVGVAKGTFYHYFQSKEDLLEQVAAWQADSLVLEPEPGTSRSASGAAVLSQLRGLLGRIAGWNPGSPPPVLRSQLRVRYRSENLALRAQLSVAAFARIHPELERVLAEGSRRGVMDVPDPDATADVVAAVWQGTADHLAGLLLVCEGHPERVADVVAHLRAMERAVERILGIRPGALRLYDYARLTVALQVVFADREVDAPATADRRRTVQRGGSR